MKRKREAESGVRSERVRSEEEEEEGRRSVLWE